MYPTGYARPVLERDIMVYHWYYTTRVTCVSEKEVVSEHIATSLSELLWGLSSTEFCADIVEQIMVG